jgi:hypothetical protein
MNLDEVVREIIDRHGRHVVLDLAVSPPRGSAPTDAFRDITPVIPTARREIARADRATAFLRVYQDAKAVALPATVTARITDTADHVVLTTSPSLPPLDSPTMRRTTSSKFRSTGSRAASIS